MASPPAASSLLDIYLALSHIILPEDDSSPLAPLAGEEPEETARVYVVRLADAEARTRAGGQWRVFLRPDMPADTRAALAALPPETLFSEYERVTCILAQGDPFARSGAAAGDLGVGLWIGHTLLFPDDLAPPPLDDTEGAQIVRLEPGVGSFGAPAPAAALRLPALAAADAPAPPPTTFPHEQFVALAHGVIASVCVSARESALGAEAWVRTLPTASRRGYATRVTAAWALDARRRGKTPFYSYSRDNHASAGVARALRLLPFLDDVGYL